mgnify:CR=1 FL=1
MSPACCLVQTEEVSVTPVSDVLVSAIPADAAGTAVEGKEVVAGAIEVAIDLDASLNPLAVIRDATVLVQSGATPD